MSNCLIINKIIYFFIKKNEYRNYSKMAGVVKKTSC